EASAAAVELLAAEAPELVAAPWVELAASAGPAEPWYALISPPLGAERASQLAERGLPMISAAREQNGTVWIEPLRAEDGAAVQIASARREARHLVEAVRPLPVRGDASADEVCFVMPASGPAARSLLERLLSLGREDIRVAEWKLEPSHEKLLV